VVEELLVNYQLRTVGELVIYQPDSDSGSDSGSDSDSGRSAEHLQAWSPHSSGGEGMEGRGRERERKRWREKGEREREEKGGGAGWGG
jgi:hypothetical protein